MTTRTARLPACALLTALALSPCHAQPSYVLFPVPDLPSAAVRSTLTAVSLDGELVGVWTSADGSRRSFAWLAQDADGRSAGMHDLGVFIDLGPEPGDRNSRREWATRSWYNADGSSSRPPRAALWIPGQSDIILGTLPGGTASAARGVTDDRAVVGWADRPGVDAHGNPLVSGLLADVTPTAFTVQEVPPPAGFDHLTLNDAASVPNLAVGTAFSRSSTPAPAAPPIALDDGMSDARAVVLDLATGTLSTIDDRLPAGCDWSVLAASSINELGWIAATAVRPDGVETAVLLLPNRADADGDGVVTTTDLSRFLAEFTAGRPAADLDADGTLSVSDVFEFVALEAAANGTGVVSATSGAGALGGGGRPIEPIDDNCLRLRTLRACATDCTKRNAENPGQYSQDCNPQCYGCSGCDEHNPNRPNGAPGWPGTDARNPDAPNGGPGGTGCPGGTLHPSQPPGSGGHGGNGATGDPAGNGGPGGAGGAVEDGTNGIGGSGGSGGEGGDNSGSPRGPGGQAGIGGEGGSGGCCGTGGMGGGGGGGGSGNPPTPGASGGKGGGSNTGFGGQGGPGGTGAQGTTGQGQTGGDVNGSSGGAGGAGGDAPNGTPGRGGQGGNGGGASGNGDGGRGGQGGSGGQGAGGTTGPGGNGGYGGSGNPQGLCGGGGAGTPQGQPCPN